MYCMLSVKSNIFFKFQIKIKHWKAYGKGYSKSQIIGPQLSFILLSMNLSNYRHCVKKEYLAFTYDVCLLHIIYLY